MAKSRGATPSPLLSQATSFVASTLDFHILLKYNGVTKHYKSLVVHSNKIHTAQSILTTMMCNEKYTHVLKERIKKQNRNDKNQ